MFTQITEKNGDQLSLEIVQNPHLASKLGQIFFSTMTVHDFHPKEEKLRFRKTDGAPYGMHPVFSGLFMLHEMSIPLKPRLIKCEALCRHDTREDTTVSDDELRRTLVFPESFPLIVGLTFEDGMNNTDEAIKRGPEIAMLKSFDGVGNLFGLEQIKWSHAKKLRRIESLEKLFAFAEPHYPDLQIWSIGRALIARYESRNVV